MFSRPIRLRLDPSRGSSSALSNSENTLKGKATVGGRIKTENYFFVPFGLKLIFTVPRELPALFILFAHKKLCWGVGGEGHEGCQMNGILFSFVFYAKRSLPSDDFKCKWEYKISVFILFPHRFSFSCFFLRPRCRCCVFFNFAPSTAAAVERGEKKEGKWENVFRVVEGVGVNVGFFVLQQKNMAWGCCLCCCYLNVKNLPSRTARHKIKFL